MTNRKVDCQSKKKIYFIYFDTKVTKSVEDLGVLIDGVSETVKQEIKEKQEGKFLGAL